MNPHFFTALFYFAFIWFRVQALVAASPPFFRRWYSRIAAFPSREGARKGWMGDYGMKDSWDKGSRSLL